MVIIKWVVAAVCAVVAWDVWMTYRYRQAFFDKVDEVPPHRYGLVLGTAPTLLSGARNRYYQYRMEAAALLYHQGKIETVVVSGTDNGMGYSEPEAMRRDLQALGVPAMSIVMDKGGFRTINSVLYAQKHGQMADWLIVSQPFHNQRALVMAKALGVRANAYNACDVQRGLKIQVRERFARLRLVWDLVMYKIGRIK